MMYRRPNAKWRRLLLEKLRGRQPLTAWEVCDLAAECKGVPDVYLSPNTIMTSLLGDGRPRMIWVACSLKRRGRNGRRLRLYRLTDEELSHENRR